MTGRVQSVGGPSVANMSLGGPISSFVDDAVTNSINAGVSFAVAAGNSSTNACNSSPARVPAAVTVGASSQSDLRASFSNYGTCLDIFAPGQDIVSNWWTDDTAKATISGTSMASPHVAGVMAAYLQANPTASPAAVRDVLVSNAGDALSNLGTGSPDKLLFSVLDGSVPNPTPTPTPAPEANVAPVATAPAAVVAGKSNSNTIGTTVPMTVSWAATDANGDAISSYALQQSTDGGTTWATVTLPASTATSATVNVGFAPVRFQARATDARGAVGGYAQGPQVTPALAQQTAATLSGKWSTVSASAASGGSSGRAQVHLDGVLQGIVDLYSSSVANKRILFSSKALTTGSHTLMIKVYDGSGYVDIDGFVTVR